MTSRFTKTFALLALASFLSIPSRSAAAQGDDSEGKRLQGTWMVQVTQRDCSLGTPLGPPFLSLLTFARGGTMTETTSNPSFFPAVRSPGHGVWQHTGHGAFQATTTAFITVNGALTRIQTLAQTIELDNDDAFHTTSAAVKFFNPDGTLLLSGCATATGTRISIE